MHVDLSIIIVTYNGLEISLQTLESYIQATRADPDHGYEFIVVDNASQECVPAAVEERYEQVQLICNDQNLGFARANNIGFAHSRGRYVLFSNPDVEVDAQTLPTLIRLMDQDPTVGACTPFLQLVKTGGVDWGAHRGFPTPWAAFTYFTRLDRLFRWSRPLSRLLGQYHLLDRDLDAAHEVDVIRGGFFFVRREAFEQAGRWDEDYFMYGEDIDLCYQLKQRGYRIMFYPQARALHYHGLTTGLKKHCQETSCIDPAVQAKVYNSFYDTMKIFYDKNYKTRYPALLRWLVFAAIDLKKKLGKRNKMV